MAPTSEHCHLLKKLEFSIKRAVKSSRYLNCPPLVGERNTLSLVLEQIHRFLPAAKVEEGLADVVALQVLFPPLHPESSEGSNAGPGRDHQDGPGGVLGQREVHLLGVLHVAGDGGAHLSRVQQP